MVEGRSTRFDRLTWTRWRWAVASFVGATTVRQNVLGEKDIDPNPQQLAQMRGLVRQAMQEGALGVGTSLIYPPASFAETDELVALTTEAAQCGGSYISHMRSEGDRLLESVDELIEISRRSGAARRRIDFTRATSSRGLNGFVM